MVWGIISSLLVRIGLIAPKVEEEEEEIIADNLHLLESGKNSDAILRCYSKTFLVHKRILNAHSDVFQAIFDSIHEDKNVVEVLDIGPVPLKEMLHFLYSGKIPESGPTHSKLKLLEAAETYAVGPLKRKCLKFIKQHLREDDICEILVFADGKKEKMVALKDIVISYLVTKKDFLESERWRMFSENNTKLANEVLTAYVRKTRR